MNDTNETYKPIASIERLQGSLRLRRRKLATPGFAAVFHREGDALRVVWPIRRDDTAPEASWLQSYDTVFQVDVGEHLLEWKLTTPSEDETLGLQTTLWFVCTVDDPAVIIERKVDNAKQAFEPLLLPKFREAGRTCSVERCADAERTIRDALPDPMYAGGFRLEHFMVAVAPDEAARKYLEERKQEAERKQRKEQEAAEAERRKREEAAEEERRRKEHREEVRTDVNFYAGLLGRADASTMWAILLAQNPDAASQLVDRFNKQLESRQDIFHGLLRTFLEGRGMEDYQVEQAVRVLWGLLMQETAPDRLLSGSPLIASSSNSAPKAAPVDEEPEDPPKPGADEGRSA
jgi:hypothetical protein